VLYKIAIVQEPLYGQVHDNKEAHFVIRNTAIY